MVEHLVFKIASPESRPRVGLIEHRQHDMADGARRAAGQRWRFMSPVMVDRFGNAKARAAVRTVIATADLDLVGLDSGRSVRPTRPANDGPDLPAGSNSCQSRCRSAR